MAFITVETIINAPLKSVWEKWTSPGACPTMELCIAGLALPKGDN